MTGTPVVYDFSKYIDYLFQDGPSGIGRIDLAFAQFFAAHPERLAFAVHDRFGIRTRVGGKAIARLLGHLNRNWNEDNETPMGQRVIDWLRAPDPSVRRLRAPKRGRRRMLERIGELTTGWPWHDPWLRWPKGALYLNAGYANTLAPERLDWLEKRPDIIPLFFVYDLLPLNYPEYFWPGSDEEFPRRLATILRYAKIVVVNSSEVAEQFTAYAAKAGRSDIVVRTIPLPPSPLFLSPDAATWPADLPPYFVICSTLEPRKNHLMLLNLWRSWARQGLQPPKLVVVGHRGWKTENLADLLDRSPVIGGHVLEVEALSTQDLRQLLQRAKGLLMPSFAEGFGLPIIEAQALGTPVIASDIPVFREVSGGLATLVDPLDTPGWGREILRLAQAPDRPQTSPVTSDPWERFFTAVLDDLPKPR